MVWRAAGRYTVTIRFRYLECDRVFFWVCRVRNDFVPTVQRGKSYSICGLIDGMTPAPIPVFCVTVSADATLWFIQYGI